MVDRVTRHAEDVVAGRYGTVGELHREACRRHLSDLEVQGTEAFPFVWDEKKGNRILEFAETLTIAEGAKPTPVKLYGFQDFDLGAPFGWVRKDTGFRRFRRKYKSVARQNGKTFENGITGTYVAGFCGYNYGKLFTVATKKRQARLAWEEMSKFIGADNDLGEIFTVHDWKSMIVAQNTHCTIEALSKEAGLDDGFRSIFSSIDELHQHKDGSVYNAIYRGTRNLDETLVSAITTRGKILNGFCREMDDYCKNILSGSIRADDMFCDIYTLDDGDNPFDPDVWIKANPLLMLSKHGVETQKSDAETAMAMGGDTLADFKTKCLNMWAVDEQTQFAHPDDWQKCAADMPIDQIRGRDVYAGLDLSSGGDLTSLSIICRMDDKKLYLWSHSFMPRGRLEEHIRSDMAPYGEWWNQGLLTVTGGECDYKNDYKYILRVLGELIEKNGLRLRGIAYDPHNADGILSDLEAFGAPLMMVKQSARELNSATQALQLDIKSGNVIYDRRQELLSWSMINARIVRNSFGEMKIDKEPGAKTKRIDPVDAIMDALTMEIKLGQVETVDKNEAMQKYLEAMGWK